MKRNKKLGIPIWGERIRNARQEQSPKETQQKLADALSEILCQSDDRTVYRENINQWESGEREPDLSIIAALAKHFRCSTDYFFGYTESLSNEKNLRDICDHTGLSDASVSILHEQQQALPLLNGFIDSFLTSEECEKITKDIMAALDCSAIQKANENTPDSRRVNTELNIREKVEEEGYVYAEHQNIQKGKVVLNPEEARYFYIDHSARLFSNYVGTFIDAMLGDKNNGK